MGYKKLGQRKAALNRLFNFKMWTGLCVYEKNSDGKPLNYRTSPKPAAAEFPALHIVLRG